MKEKKGFTLIELLAVIAILGILVIVVTMNVLRIYRNAKEDAFITQVQSIYKAAEQRYMSDSLLEQRADVCYDNETNPFDLNGQEIDYFLKFNDEGKIIYIVTKDENYKIIAGNTENKESIRQNEMGTSNSDAKYKSSVLEEDIILPKCFIMDLPSIVFGDGTDGVYPTRGFLSKDKLYKEDGKSILEKLDQMPTKKGHKFLGYYIPGTNDKIIDENGKVVDENIKKLSESVTLEAKWEAIEYYIEFNGNGNTSGEMKKISIMYGEEGILPLNEYKKTGSIFKGWSRKKEVQEIEFIDGAGVTNLADAGETITLYAIWEECGSGLYSDEETNTCQKCPIGSVCTGGVIEKTCEAGTYNDGSTNTCKVCPAGSYCAGGSAKEECPVGTYGNKEGQATEEEACTVCPSGSTCSGGADVQTCNAGTYNDGSTNTCIICPAGSYCTGGNKKEVCASGTYGNKLGQTSKETGCTKCEAGHSCSGGTNNEVCPANKYAVAGSSSCTACISGYTVAEGEGVAATSCKMTVPAGKQVKTAGGTATNCDANSYSKAIVINQTETHACTACANGYTVASGAGVEEESCKMTIPAGKEVTTKGGSATSCKAGRSSVERTINQTETSECTSCAAGTYNSTEGSNNCSVCPVGYYCTGETNKTACPAGTYGTKEGQKTQETACTSCPAGSTCSGGADVQTCSAGTYNDGTTNTCIICPVGSVCTGGSAKEACASGTYGNKLGQTSKETGCTACPAGHSCSGGSNNEACPANKYAVAGSSSCTACASGYTVAEGEGTEESSCKMVIAAGKRVTAKKGSAVNCAANTYSTQRTINQTQTSDCTACANGYTVAEGQGTAENTCKMTVAAGKRVTTKKGASENCAANTYSTSREIDQTQTTACIACATGYTVASGSGTAENTCKMTVAAGKQVKTAKGASENCAANTYSTSREIDQTQTTACTACANGYTVAAGQGTAENTCKMTVPAGKRVTTKKGAAENCAANTYSTSIVISQTETRSCTACASGYTVAAGSGTAENTCKMTIPAGKEVTTKGGSATNCKAGRSSVERTINQTETSECTSCVAGTYNSTEGSNSCSVCPVGYYCTGETNKTACPAGTYGTKEGQKTKEAACTSCPAGSTCSGGSNVQTCSAGTYNDGSTNTCIICPAGSYCTGGTNKTACPAGTYGSNQGQTSKETGCTRCPTGYSCTGGTNKTANTYTVALDMQGGIGGTASVTVTYNSAMPAITIPTRAGYIFGGYYTQVNGGGVQYYTSSGTSAKNWNIANNTTRLYAKWIKYTDVALNGADPVLKSPMIPVKINDAGVVTYADTAKEWYNYTNKQWANAVILVDTPSKTYNVGEVIAESDIRAYFVWIPKYKYKIWNLGNYTGKGGDASQIQIIDVVFGTGTTSEINGVECPTPMISGESGTCAIGEYMTHPAFLSIPSNGFWIGKFEVGYNQNDDTTIPITDTSKWTTAKAQKNESNFAKVIVKPNVYSWRYASVYNLFTSMYNFNRNLDSHMLKNTEWGAVAYLSHSKYGIGKEIRINNNKNYLTGYSANTENAASSTTTNTVWNTTNGYLASTTGNISGVYDMSGGATEYTASYIDGNPKSSGMSPIIEDSTYNQYIEKYLSTNFKNRILGDATGEMGPFTTKTYSEASWYVSANWYDDAAIFVSSTYPWFSRGYANTYSNRAGVFSFYHGHGSVYETFGTRLILTPR